VPPLTVEGDGRIAVDHAERDLGRGTPERGSDWFAAVILDPHGTSRRCRASAHVASIDPRMPVLPPAGALGGDDGEIIHESWLTAHSYR
jgi:hypothetical protein